jgi:hypothetical protein
MNAECPGFRSKSSDLAHPSGVRRPLIREDAHVVDPTLVRSGRRWRRAASGSPGRRQDTTRGRADCRRVPRQGRDCGSHRAQRRVRSAADQILLRRPSRHPEVDGSRVRAGRHGADHVQRMADQHWRQAGARRHRLFHRRWSDGRQDAEGAGRRWRRSRRHRCGRHHPHPSRSLQRLADAGETSRFPQRDHPRQRR